MQARNDVFWGRLTVTQASNKYGVHRTTIWRWVKRAKEFKLNGNAFIWTLPSIPKHHPNELRIEVVDRIVELRKKLDRCAPIIHAHLKAEGIKVGLSTVGKVLKKHKLVRKKKQFKDYKPFPRPIADSPGSLVQVDTIHFVKSDYRRVFVYAVIDVFSRLGHAEYKAHISAKETLKVILNAQKYFGFKFGVVQTDNGAEFPPLLGYYLNKLGIKLRHSRVRKPNDNAHVERFIRTVQEECFKGRLPEEDKVEKKLRNYIEYYNNKKLHLGINCQTPSEYVAKVSN
jgi:transposase InsO family protein